MTLIRLDLRAGDSIFDQVVLAAVKAFVGGEFQAGQPFPSVRALAADLKIHPNTAHKIVQHLIQEGWLESRPGIGTVVAHRPEARSGERRRLLRHELEALVIEARRIGMPLEELLEAVTAQWRALGSAPGGRRS